MRRKGGAPWRHAHIDDKNQIAREPVFQAERVPVRADRTRLPRRKQGGISICVKV